MDTKYAIECINEIINEYDKLLKMYDSKPYEEMTIKEKQDLYIQHDLTCGKIREYFEYLEQVNVDPEESYLVKWMSDCDVDEVLDNIKCLLET